MAKIYIDKNNFYTNLDIITKLTNDVNKIAIVLKDNAYGHSLDIISELASSYGVMNAVVRDEFEALQIKDKFKSIIILNDFPSKAENNFSYVVNDISMLSKISDKVNIELKVDTGMGRNGISFNQIIEAFEIINARELKLIGVMSHYFNADVDSKDFDIQKKQFDKIKKIVKNLYSSKLRFHIANSAGTIRGFSDDLARVGIAAYGAIEIAKNLCPYDFKPVLSLEANIISTRTIDKGDIVGYGASFKSKEHCVVSNYDFGYADGFRRSLSNDFTAKSGEKLVGRISMDNSSFLGKSKVISIFDDVREVSGKCETISYEILTALNCKIKREVK